MKKLLFLLLLFPLFSSAQIVYSYQHWADGGQFDRRILLPQDTSAHMGSHVVWIGGQVLALGLDGFYHSLAGGAPISTTIPWDSVTGKPNFQAIAFSGSWADLVDPPNSLAGYGITDAVNTGLTYNQPSWLIGVKWDIVSGFKGDSVAAGFHTRGYYDARYGGGGGSFDSLMSQGGVFHTQAYNDVHYRAPMDTLYAHLLMSRPWGYKIADSLGIIKANALNASLTGYIWSHGWATAGRPVSPSPGYFGFNQDSLKFEYSDGTSWHTFGGDVEAGGFNKYIYNSYGSPSILPIFDNVDQFVDANNGNNANGGTTESLAKKTIASAMSVAGPIAATNSTARIALHDSSTFRETMAPSNDGIRFSGYKLGYNREVRLPIITGADTVKHGWTKTSGKTNIWQKDIATDYSVSQSNYDLMQVIETDTSWEKIAPFSARKYFALVANTTACDTVPGSYFASSSLSNPVTVYVHTTTNDQPDTNAYKYEVTTRMNVMNTASAGSGALGKKNTFLENLIMRDMTNGYGVGVGDGGYTHKVLFDGGGTHNLVQNSGTADNCIFHGGSYGATNSQISLAFYNSDGFNRDNKVINSVFFSTPHGIICHQSGIGSAPMESIYIDNDFIFSAPFGAAITADICKNITIKNTYVDSAGTAFQFGYGNITIEKSVFNNTTARSGLNYPQNYRANLKMWNSILVSTGDNLGTGTYSLWGNQDSGSVNLRNNVFYSKNTYTGGHVFLNFPTADSANVKSYNNVFIATGSGAGLNKLSRYTISNSNSLGPNYSVNYRGDNNIFIIGPGSAGFQWTVFNPNNNYTNLTQWQTASGQDLHSLVIDVSNDANGLKSIFVDPDNGNWKLLPAGNKWADSIRAHRAGLLSAITAYPVRPTLEDAYFTMLQDGPKSMAWSTATGSTLIPVGTLNAMGIVQANQTGTRFEAGNKMTITGNAPIDINFDAAHSIRSNNHILYATSLTSYNAYGVADKKIPANTDGYVEMYNSPDSSSQYGVLMLLTKDSSEQINGVDNLYAVDRHDANVWYRWAGTGSATSISVSARAGQWVRLSRVAGTVTVDTSADEFNWATIYTFATTYNGDLYPNVNLGNPFGTNTGRVFYPKCYNCVPKSLITGLPWTGAQNMTGATVTVATQTAGDNTTKAASTAFVTTAVGSPERLAYSQYSGVTVTNSTTETNIVGGPGYGTVTLPAGSIVQGKTYRYRITGLYSTTTVPGNLTIRIKIGSVTIATAVVSNLGASVTNNAFSATGVIVCSALVGSSATIKTDGEITYVSTLLSPRNSDDLNNFAGASTVTNSTTNDFIITAQWATASSSNIITSVICTLEAEN